MPSSIMASAPSRSPRPKASYEERTAARLSSWADKAADSTQSALPSSTSALRGGHDARRAPVPLAGHHACGLRRAPGAAFVGDDRSMPLQHGVDHAPGSFHHVLAREQTLVARECISQETNVRLPRPAAQRLLIGDVEVHPLAEHAVARELRLHLERDRVVGLETKAQYVGIRP